MKDKGLALDIVIFVLLTLLWPVTWVWMRVEEWRERRREHG